MKMLALDASFINEDLTKDFDGKNAIERIFELAQNNKYDRYILLQRGAISTVPNGIKNVVLKNLRAREILQTIFDESRNCDDIVIFDAGNPFYDYKFVDEMLERHNKFIADFTYAMGYPDGLTPRIVKKEIIPEIIKLVEEDEAIEKDWLFYSLSKDINSFDIETFLADIDLRLFRIKFGSNDVGERVFAAKIFKRFSNIPDIKEIERYLSENVSELYTVPYMVTFELNSRPALESIYRLPTNDPGALIDVEVCKKAIFQIKEINSDAVILFGGRGEIFGHPEVFELIDFVSKNGMKLILESDGVSEVGDIAGNLDKIKIDKSAFFVVLKYDAYDETTYKKIRPNGDFAKLNALFAELTKKGYKTYKEVTRTVDNEIEIEKYIRNTDKEGNSQADSLIIRKYSTYCGALPDKKVVDLSPLERIPCFHLRREIFVKSNVDVPICRYKPDRIIGNIQTNSIGDISDKLNGEYRKNSKLEYHEFCKNCDDYYIFNF